MTQARSPFRTLTQRLLPALALAAGLGATGMAHADSAGAWGRVVGVHVNGSGSDDYKLVRGKVLIAGQKTSKKAPAPTEEYSFGGTTCQGRDLTPDQIEQLQGALSNRAHLRVQPFYKAGQGGAKCIVGFDIRGREAVPSQSTPPT